MSQPVLTRLSVMELTPLGGADATGGFYALRLAPPPWKAWNPGQFVMLRPSDSGEETLWARPFSICRADKGGLVIFFQARGRVTDRMARLAPGAVLDVWGPLGNGLAVEAGVPTLLLAGGIGIAPFVAYARAHPTPEELSLEFGHRMPLSCYPFDDIGAKIAARAHHENNEADRDNFLRLVGKRMERFAARKGLVLACGPAPFLETVQDLSLKHGARTQLCLETRMACGIGACLGCVVEAADRRPGARPFAGEAAPDIRPATEPSRTCACGPNFWADAVRLR